MNSIENEFAKKLVPSKTLGYSLNKKRSHHYSLQNLNNSPLNILPSVQRIRKSKNPQQKRTNNVVKEAIINIKRFKNEVGVQGFQNFRQTTSKKKFATEPKFK